jgi:hypothetical protein
MVRHEKPRILLVDTGSQVNKALEEMGLNVTQGTFGHPYKVKPSDSYSPVVSTCSLPNAYEQELVIVDLASPELIDHVDNKDARLEAADSILCELQTGNNRS